MKYRLLKNSEVDNNAKVGMIVYNLRHSDYGISSDDTRLFGYKCISVTLDQNGDYPGFSIPRHDLEKIDD